MRNLADDPECDRFISNELRRAGIDAVHGGRWPGEVAASVTGQLGEFRFRRAWYYWIAEGPVPIEVARELYADPVGAEDVRVCGNGCRPSPDAHGAEWFTADGRRLLDLGQKAEAERYAASNSESLREVAARILAECEFAENPSAVGRGFIRSYHIDTEVGLRLFADTLKRHALAYPNATVATVSPVLPDISLRDAVSALRSRLGCGVYPHYVQSIGEAAGSSGVPPRIHVFLVREPRGNEKPIPVTWHGYPVETKVTGEMRLCGEGNADA